MPTLLQHNLRMPLLFEIAVWRAGYVDATPRSDISDLVGYLAAPRGIPDQDCGPKGKFYNDVLWAKKLLEEEGSLIVTPRREWRVSEKGFELLRSRILWRLKHEPAVATRLLSANEGDCESLCLSLLKLLSEENLWKVVNNSTDLVALMSRAIQILDHQRLSRFLSCLPQEIVP